MADFNSIYNDVLQRASRRGTVSPEIEPLLKRFYFELERTPTDLASLKTALVDLLHFLTTSNGRTEANCYVVDLFVCLGDWGEDWPDLPDGYNDVIADMGGALHDTISAPDIASNFDSTPEQLLSRAREL